jgi:hypothetical protein
MAPTVLQIQTQLVHVPQDSSQQLAPSLAVAHVQQSGRQHSTHAANTLV